MALCLRAEDHSRRWSAGICPPGSKSEGELADGIAPVALSIGLDLVCCGPGKKSTGWWSASFPADLSWSSGKQWHWANQIELWHSEPEGVLRAVTHTHVISLAAGWRATEQATEQWDERAAETAVKTQCEGESTLYLLKGCCSWGLWSRYFMPASSNSVQCPDTPNHSEEKELSFLKIMMTNLNCTGL